MTSSKKLNFAPLRKVMDKIDDNGKHGRCGNWEMGLGGYDMGYEIYYKGTPVARVNYEFKEYELYYDGFVTRETLPKFLKAIDAVGFKNIHEKDTGPYKEGDWVKWRGQEWYIDDGWFDDEDRHYLYTIKQANGHKMDAVPEEELTPTNDEDEEMMQESGESNLETFLSEKEREFEPSGVNPSWDLSEDKVWAVQEYLSQMGGFTDEDREFLKQTDPELLSLEDEES